MEYFIKLIAAALAMPIESGSRRGALAGAVTGFVLAVATATVLSIAEELGAYRSAVFIILPVPFTIGGALIGASFYRNDRIAFTI